MAVIVLLSCLFNVHSVFIDDFLASGRGEADQFPQLEFEQLPFSHPLYIMYSSGTTGAPKCMVHSAGVRTSAGFPSISKVFTSLLSLSWHKHKALNILHSKTKQRAVLSHGLTH